jgi:hypothetical protein
MRLPTFALFSRAFRVTRGDPWRPLLRAANRAWIARPLAPDRCVTGLRRRHCRPHPRCAVGSGRAGPAASLRSRTCESCASRPHARESSWELNGGRPGRRCWHWGRRLPGRLSRPPVRVFHRRARPAFSQVRLDMSGLVQLPSLAGIYPCSPVSVVQEWYGRRHRAESFETRRSRHLCNSIAVSSVARQSSAPRWTPQARWPDRCRWPPQTARWRTRGSERRPPTESEQLCGAASQDC